MQVLIHVIESSLGIRGGWWGLILSLYGNDIMETRKKALYVHGAWDRNFWYIGGRWWKTAYWIMFVRALYLNPVKCAPNQCWSSDTNIYISKSMRHVSNLAQTRDSNPCNFCTVVFWDQVEYYPHTSGWPVGSMHKTRWSLTQGKMEIFGRTTATDNGYWLPNNVREVCGLCLPCC